MRWSSVAARPARPPPTIWRGAATRVLLLDRAGRIKPCGGAIPPRLIKDFAIPDSLLVARATSARMVVAGRCTGSTSRSKNGFVGMVDRDVFDEWLRERARARTARCAAPARSRSLSSQDDDGTSVVHYLAARRHHHRGEGVPATRSGAGASSVPTVPDRNVAREAQGAEVPIARATCSRITRSCARRRSQALRATTARVATSSIKRRAVARFLRLGLPARRHAQHRHRQRRQGLFAARRRRHVALRTRAWRAPRHFAAKARRSRCSRCRAGTTAATPSLPATPPAWSRRHRAKASTTRWPAGALPPKPPAQFLRTGDARALALRAQALHEVRTARCSGCWA